MKTDLLINHIEQAFSHVRLDDGVSLCYAQYIDSHRFDYFSLVRSWFDEKDDWRRISNKNIVSNSTYFTFCDSKGFRFHLPAYMTWCLKNVDRDPGSAVFDITVESLCAETITRLYGEDVCRILDCHQLNSVRMFLEFCCWKGYPFWPEECGNLLKVYSCYHFN